MKEKSLIMKYDELLNLIQIQLKEKNLSLNSPLKDLSIYYKNNDTFRDELKRRLQNGANPVTIISLYKNELFDNLIVHLSRIDPLMGITHEQARETNFGIKLYNNVNSGNYQVINDSIKEFFSYYFQPSSNKKENVNRVNDLLEKLAELCSKIMFIIELEALVISFNTKGAQIKNLIYKHLNISSKMDKEVVKIKWGGSIAELAKLFTTLAHKEWIPDFQKSKNGPNTARAILNCFSINDEDSNTEANYHTLQQALKLDSTGELSSESTNYYFGTIRKNPKPKK